ncbi:MAG: DUF4124 domain-containing protein [Candidatus Methylopumilus sp.]|jgi:hypothetical protein
MQAIIFAFSLLLFAASPVSAQVYKCTTQQNKVAYTDTSCVTGSKQITTDIQSQPSPAALKSIVSNTDANITRQLDAAVKLAISNDDLVRAQALATTPEQKQWVAAARKEASKKVMAGRTEADLNAERANSYACRQAQRNLEMEGNSIFRDAASIATKTSLMQASCGISQPNIGYGYAPPPYLFSPGRPHFNQQPGYTSEPYDRTRASPFGSRWIRPEY